MVTRVSKTNVELTHTREKNNIYYNLNQLVYWIQSLRKFNFYIAKNIWATVFHHSENKTPSMQASLDFILFIFSEVLQSQLCVTKEYR